MQKLLLAYLLLNAFVTSTLGSVTYFEGEQDEYQLLNNCSRFDAEWKSLSNTPHSRKKRFLAFPQGSSLSITPVLVAPVTNVPGLNQLSFLASYYFPLDVMFPIPIITTTTTPRSTTTIPSTTTLKSRYGVPSYLTTPKSRYEVPSYLTTPKSLYGVPSYLTTPKSLYGAPFYSTTPKGRYGFPLTTTPKGLYGVPSTTQGYRAPGGGNNAPQKAPTKKASVSSDSKSSYTSYAASKMDSVESFNRISFYEYIEDVLTSRGYNGHQCTLRTLCEIADEPFDHGLFGEIINLIMSGSMNPTEDGMYDNYMLAEYYGRYYGHCHKIYPKCPESVLGLVSGVN